MLDAEAAWVQVQADAGLCSIEDAQAVREVASVDRYDLALLASKTPDGANALIPLLGMMRELLTHDGAVSMMSWLVAPRCKAVLAVFAAPSCTSSSRIMPSSGISALAPSGVLDASSARS